MIHEIPVSVFSVGNPIFPSDSSRDCPKNTKDGCSRSSFHKRVIRDGHSKNLDMKEQATNMIKLKFIRNKAVLKITNKTHETVTFGWTEMIGVVDLRSLGFYKIKQEVLQEHLGRH